MKQGFTLIEFLVAITIVAFIFVISTSLVVNLSRFTDKSRNSEDIQHAKNQIEGELLRSLKWAQESIVYDNGALYVDGVKYFLNDGKFIRDGVTLTPDDIVVESFEVTKQSNDVTLSGLLTGSGLTGEYFNSKNLSNSVYEEISPTINFNWVDKAPNVEGLGKDAFSVMWSGLVESVVEGNYQFVIESDDGVRLYIDDQLLINNWKDGLSRVTGNIFFDANSRYPIYLEYYENKENAEVAMYWVPPGMEEELVPVTNLYPQTTQTSIDITIVLRHVDSNETEILHTVMSPRKPQIVGDLPTSIPNPTITRKPTRHPSKNPTPRLTPRPTNPPLR